MRNKPETGDMPSAPKRYPYRALLDRNDYIIMAVMTAVYLAVALFNLGRIDVPKTGWKPSKAGEQFVIKIDRPRVITRVYYYAGLGDGRDASGKYHIDFMDGVGKYYPLAAIDKKEIFTWKYLNTPAVLTDRLRVTVDEPGGTLNELVFLGRDSKAPISGIVVTARNTDQSDAGKVENLFDEQASFEYRPSYLSDMIFDEVYHARTAYEHIHRIEPFETVHPPLGKDLIALGILVFGMSPFGWRIVGTLFGALMLPAMYVFARRLFGGRFYGFAAAFLMMFDFMHFTLTRIGTVDSYVTFFSLMMFYFMYKYTSVRSYEAGFRESLKPLFFSGLFFGLGAATKWNAVYGVPGLALLFFMAKYGEYKDYRSLMEKGSRETWLKDYVSKYVFGTFLFCMVFFVVVPVCIYILSYIPFMLVPGPYHGLADLPRVMEGMYHYHKTLVATHPFESSWWEWPLMIKPVWFYMGSDMPAGMASTIATFGNPAIWWVGIPAAFFAAGIAAERRDRNILVVFIALLSLYLPWLLVSRIAFIYHFFPVLPFVMLAIVYVLKSMAENYRGWRHFGYVYLAVVALLFIVFYPALSGMEVSQGYIAHLKWLKSWYF